MPHDNPTVPQTIPHVAHLCHMTTPKGGNRKIRMMKWKRRRGDNRGTEERGRVTTKTKEYAPKRRGKACHMLRPLESYGRRYVARGDFRGGARKLATLGVAQSRGAELAASRSAQRKRPHFLSTTAMRMSCPRSRPLRGPTGPSIFRCAQ